MSTDTKWQINSVSSEETERLAQKMGRALRGGEVIELISDLGGGKTTFVRGLARGAASADRVASPTFTISKIYKAHAFDIHHFDFYRLAEAGIMADELAEIVGDPQAVVVVEWGNAVTHVLPQERLTLHIAQLPHGGARQLTFAAPQPLKYLIEAMQR